MDQTILNSASSSGYDQLAPLYRDYSQKKAAYLEAVNAFVLSNLPSSAASLLDVGAGDGYRGMAIAKASGIKRVVLCDASSEMVRQCLARNPTQVIHSYAEELPSLEPGFDVVLCLWNVLGHIEGREKRIEALSRMRRALLSSDSVLFLDVNNRHNASAYGWRRVIARMTLDSIWPDEKRGDTSFVWKIGDKAVEGMGHLFTYSEMQSLFRAAGLRIRAVKFIDYVSGKSARFRTGGQMNFMLGKG